MQKISQHVGECSLMFLFSTVAGFVHILDDHRPDALGAMPEF